MSDEYCYQVEDEQPVTPDREPDIRCRGNVDIAKSKIWLEEKVISVKPTGTFYKVYDFKNPEHVFRIGQKNVSDFDELIDKILKYEDLQTTWAVDITDYYIEKELLL